jgi:hypothetical protein
MAGAGVDFSGTWQCIRCDGFEAYLDALRVSPHIKRALMQSGSRPTHVIQHTAGGERLEWCVDSPGGRVVSVQRVGHRTVTKNPHGDVVEVRPSLPLPSCSPPPPRRVRKAVTSKAGPRQQQDWFLSCLHPG